MRLFPGCGDPERVQGGVQIWLAWGAHVCLGDSLTSLWELKTRDKREINQTHTHTQKKNKAILLQLSHIKNHDCLLKGTVHPRGACGILSQGTHGTSRIFFFNYYVGGNDLIMYKKTDRLSLSCSHRKSDARNCTPHSTLEKSFKDLRGSISPSQLNSFRPFCNCFNQI